MPRKLLIIGPAWVGDMVMAQALFKVLKEQDTDTQINVLASAWTFSILTRMPEVDGAIEMPIQHGELKLKVRIALAKRLRTNRYDHAIVLPNSFKAALIPWLAGIPKRTGWQGEGRYFLLNDLRHLDKKRYPLMIERFMALAWPKKSALIKPYPLPKLEVDAESTKTLLKRLKLLPTTKILALSPGAAFGTAKRWPVEYYAEIAKNKLAEGWQVWLFGSKDDALMTQHIMQLTAYACEDFAGRISLAETIDLISISTGLVTNDSGLMHIAAALDKPVVAIYGSTSPAFTPPLSEQATVLKLNLACQPCFARDCPLTHHQCMRNLKPASVLAAIAGWNV